MIVVDSSAIIAILFGEPSAASLRDCLETEFVVGDFGTTHVTVAVNRRSP